MPNRMISLSEEMFERLKLEENASGLIDKCLRNYYDLISSPKDKLEEIKKEIEIKNQQASVLQNKVIEMEKKKEEIVEQQLQEYNQKEDSEEVWERRKKLQREAFNLYEVDKEKAEEIFIEFFNLLREKRINNMIEFMQAKGINRKPEKKR